MALEYLLLVSLFCSISMSYDNGLQLWKDCPSMQSIRGSKGSHFEITIQTFNNECKTLLSKSGIEEATKIRKQRNSLDMKLTINKERANITWNVQFKNWCYRHIYMLDVEYLIRNFQGNGASASHWCFQYNVSNVENKQQKETVDLYFDCIRTVPDKEAYLVNIKLWSLQQNWSLSSRSRRSVKSNCGRIQCTTSMKKFLSIGPIKPLTGKVDDKERTKRCQCWSNSTISLNQTTNTNFLIAVDNPNPYATVTLMKVYKEGNNTFPVFTVSSVEKVNKFLTDISCEKEEGTYTPVLGYYCGGGEEYSTNSLCQLQDIEGPSITCPGPVKKPVPPSEDIPHITIVISVLTGVIVTVTVTVIAFVCKRKAFRKSFMREAHLNWDNRFNPDVSSVESRIEYLGEDGEYVPRQLLGLPDLSSGSRQIMFLNHTDSSITPLRKDCVNLISELLQTVGIELLGLDRIQLFKNWIEVAERASKDDITEFLIIISRELVSCQNAYMKPSSNSEANSMGSQNSTYFPGAVLKILLERSILQHRVPFRIHILCLTHSDSQLCEEYIDTYSTFMIVKGDRKNTFLYYFAKHLQHTNSFIFDENVIPRLLERLNGTTTLPENIKTYASKLKEKFSELFEESTPAPLGKRTNTDINYAIQDLEHTQSNKRKHKDRSE